MYKMHSNVFNLKVGSKIKFFERSSEFSLCKNCPKRKVPHLVQQKYFERSPAMWVCGNGGKLHMYVQFAKKMYLIFDIYAHISYLTSR